MTDAVFAVQIDPKTSQLAVTGGQDDKAFVWNIITGEVLFECTGRSGGQDDKAFVWNIITGEVLFECTGRYLEVRMIKPLCGTSSLERCSLSAQVGIWNTE